MTTDKDDSTLKVPEPLLQKVRRLNSLMKGVDNPAMMTQTPTQHKDSASNNVDNSQGPATGTSWVFTPTKNKPEGRKNFHESWVTIERYIESRRKEALVRKQRCPCCTRKCRIVTAISLLGALVMAAIILIVYFVVFSRKGYMLKDSPFVEPTLFPPSNAVAPSAGMWENHIEEETTFFPDTTTNRSPVTTTAVPTSSAFTVLATTLPPFLVKHLAHLLTSTEKQPTTSPSTTTSISTTPAISTPAWIGGFVPMTPTPNPDLQNLLRLPGPLQRLNTDHST